MGSSGYSDQQQLSAKLKEEEEKGEE